MEFNDLYKIFIYDYLKYFRILFLSIFVCIFYVYCKRKSATNLMKGVPCTKIKPWQLFGHTQLFSRDIWRTRKLPCSFDVYDFQSIMGYATLFQKAGICFLWQIVTPTVMVYKADTVKAILNHSTELRKGWMYNFLHVWLGTGLLTSEGEKWRKRRKLLTPTFHFDILKDFLPCFNIQSQILVDVLREQVGESWIDVVPYLTRCSLDIICETTLGVKVESQTNAQSKYVKAVLELSETMFRRAISPWLWPDIIFRISPYGRKFLKNLEIVQTFTKKVIAQKKEIKEKEAMESELILEEGGVYRHRQKRALLDFLIEEHLKNNSITDEDIREEIDTFTFEGHDTTSMSMSWAIYLIGLHPVVQEKLQEELKSIFGDDQERPITTNDIAEMRYLESILKETLRLYPPVAYFSRELIEDTEIKGHTIPKGTTCGVLSYCLHRDPSVFPNPEKFDPDRFLPGYCEAREAFAYVPFSAGPRNCIGQKFAMMELKTVVASLCRNFHVRSLDPRDKVHVIDNIILRAEENIRIELANRKL